MERYSKANESMIDNIRRFIETEGLHSFFSVTRQVLRQCDANKVQLDTYEAMLNSISELLKAKRKEQIRGL